MARPKARSFARQIQFYYYEVYGREEGTIQKTRVSNLPAVFEYVNSLPCSHEVNPSRYVFENDEDDYAMFVDGIKEDYIEGRLARVRRGLLPDLEVDGQITPLTVDSGAGVAEITHFVLFLKAPIVGVEYNFYGPRARRIGWYLQEQLPAEIKATYFTPCVSEDISRTLKKIREVGTITLAVRPESTDVLSEMDPGWSAAFDGLKEQHPEAERIEISIKAEPKKEGIRLPFLKKLPALLKRDDFRDAFDLFRFEGVKAEGIEDKLDLLHDKLVSRKKVMALNDTSRSLEKVAAYNAIREAFEDVKDSLPRQFLQE